MRELKKQLSNYSEEWETLVDMLFVPKCEYLGYCPEEYSCGRVPKRGIN
jgi:thymidylate synthase (FAD)